MVDIKRIFSKKLIFVYILMPKGFEIKDTTTRYLLHILRLSFLFNRIDKLHTYSREYIIHMVLP